MMCFIFCCACTKEDPLTISDPSLELKYDSKHLFTVKKGAQTLSNSLIDWKVSDTKIGTIDYDGNFKGRKIGKTDVIAYTNEGTVKASVEITPYTNMYTEPSVDFKKSAQAIKSMEKRKIKSEDNEYIFYAGENSKVQYVIYHFTNNQLESSLVILTTTKAVVNELADFIHERYPVSGVFQGLAVALDDNKNYCIFMDVDDSLGLVAMYLPYTPNKREKPDPDYLKNILKSYKEAMRAKK